MAGTFVWLDIGVVKKSFAIFDPRERITDVCLARANRFDFATFQFDARFVPLENAIVTEHFAIGDRFARHFAYAELATNERTR